jgi:hypothetical protein
MIEIFILQISLAHKPNNSCFEMLKLEDANNNIFAKVCFFLQRKNLNVIFFKKNLAKP